MFLEFNIIETKRQQISNTLLEMATVYHLQN